MKTLLFLAFMLCVFTISAQESVITGRVTGAGGTMLPVGHVHLVRYQTNEKPISAEIGRDGKYVLKTTETGLFSLQFTGVNHDMASFHPLLLDKPKTFTADASLKKYGYSTDFKELSVIGDFNKFSFTDPLPMQKQPNGTYSVEIPTTESAVKYQILGIVEMNGGARSVNGTQSESYEYDGGGDYRSIVTAKNGVAKIVFDPKKISRSTAEEKIFVDEIASRSFKEMTDRINVQSRKYYGAYMSHKSQGKPMGEFKFDLSKEFEDAFRRAITKSPAERSAGLFEYMSLAALAKMNNDSTAYRPEIVRQALAETPATSWYWAVNPQLPAQITSLTREERFKNFADDIAEKHPDKSLRATVLLRLMEFNYKKEHNETSLKYYNRLVTEFPESYQANMAKGRFSPDRNIQLGKIIPQFSIASLDDKNVTFSNESLKGKVWLVDFWATWCGPCMGEMPKIHAAYEKFKDRGFDIISLSFDAKPEDVGKMRAKGKFPMPWKHAFVEGGFKSDLGKQFEVMGIPKPILIDSQGKIIAVESELRGDNLDKTLESVLGDSSQK
ncbi:MAG: redoxin family protein [Bacteroidota bacterium]